MIDSIQVKNRRVSTRKTLDRMKNTQIMFSLLTKPTEKELESVVKHLGVEKKLLKRTTNFHYARVLHAKPLMLVFKDNYATTKGFSASIITVIIKKRNVVVLTQTNVAYYRRLFEKVIEQAKQESPKDIGILLYFFFLDNVEENYDVLKNTEEEINKIESKVARGKKLVDVTPILKLKRRISHISAELSSQLKVINHLRTQAADLNISKQSREKLNGISELLIHQIEIIAGQREMFTELITINTINSSNELNEVSNKLNHALRRMTGAATVFIVPGVVAGIYGMNFINIPLKTHPHGFYITISFLALLSFITYFVMKQKKIL